MNRLSDPGYLREVLSRHGFHFSKALGQNFIVNPGVCPRMAAESGAKDCAGVIEIGPGMGVLTRELSQVAKKVVAIELDRRLFPVLEETLEGCRNVVLVEGDVLKLDLRELIEEQFDGEEVCVCANLPYYITSPVIMGLLESNLPLQSMTVMVQKEAAKRICARPGERECGAVSASVWYHAEPKLLFTVGRGSFFPQPKVDSAVIRLELRKTPPIEVLDKPQFFEVVRSAFSQRRKTAANSICAAGKYTKAQVERALEAAAGAEKNARVESLTLEQLCALANGLKQEYTEREKREGDSA